MKKILLCGVAALAVTVASPAQAEIDLGLGGQFYGYGVYTDTDNDSDLRDFDIRKESEIHVTGETTLDNGLTIGAHIETDVDGSDNANISESYMYLSGGWGRVNFGEEDGAAFLLQVAAPSADEEIDGIDPDINAFDLSAISGITNAFSLGSDQLAYGLESTEEVFKITYFTPSFNGFQAGVSFVPAVTDTPNDSEAAATTDNDAGEFGEAYEIAVRYQGDFQGTDVTVGAGYSISLTEEDDPTVTNAGSDDRDLFNVGLNVGLNNGIGLGAVYFMDNNGIDDEGDTDIFVLGADYVDGPFKYGVSYYDRTDEANNFVTTGDLDTYRVTAGVGYQYGPGMSLNGSVAYVDIEDDASSGDGFQVAVGTRINF